VTRILGQHELDPTKNLIPVAPALHYAMGGIRTDLDGRTTRPGLWAVGEVACTGVHGANRLASNSLIEGMVFADRVAKALIADTRETAEISSARALGPTRPIPRRQADAFTARLRSAARAQHPVPAFPPASGDALAGRAADDAARPVLNQVREIMTNDVGLVRTETGLSRARHTLGLLSRQLPPDAWRSRNQVLVARLITHAALRRRESRGGHRRLDYPPLTKVGGRPA
jgi:L-aspartate oxidase